MTENNNSSVKSKRTFTRNQKRLTFYILMFALPLLQFALFYLYVNFNSIIIAFKMEMVGSTLTLPSFEWAFSTFFSAEGGIMIWRSVQLLACQLFLVIPLALLFSYYIAKEKPGSGFFRVVLYLPQVISVVVLGLLFKFIVVDVYPAVAKNLFGETVKGFLNVGLGGNTPDENFYTASLYIKNLA